MARRSKLEHGDWTGRIRAAGFTGQPVSESIGKGQRTADEIFNSWWTSRVGHHDNIVNPEFRWVGFGRAVGIGGIPYWCAAYGG